ncbi:MAG: MMPL family transporter [Gammaproteobacteria bacterium]
MRQVALVLADAVSRRPRGIVFVFVTATLVAALATPIEVSHRYDDWIDHDSAQYRAYTDLRERFGDADTLLAVFDRHALSADRYGAYAAFVDRLQALPGALAVLDPTRLLLGADATHPPSEDDFTLLADAMHARPADFRHVLFAPASDSIGLLVLADPEARDAHDALVSSVQDGFRQAGIDVELAGTVWFTHTLSTAIAHDLARVVTLLAVVAAILLRVFLRDTRVVLAIGVGIGISVVQALCLAAALGLYLDLLTLLLLPLVIGVGLTTTVHLFTRRCGGCWNYAAALARVLHPATLAVLTTAIGCAAFAAAPQPAIARMGTVMPGAVAMTFLTSIVFVPALFAWVARGRTLPPLSGYTPRPSALVRRVVSGVLALLALAAVAALPRLHTAPDALDFFPADSALVRAYRDIEQRLTGLLVVDVVIASEDGRNLREAEHARAVASFSQRLRALPEMTTLVSGYDVERFARFLPQTPSDIGGRLFSADASATRLVLRLRNVASRPWSRITADIDAAWATTPHAGLTMQITGLIPLILEAQDRLLVIQSRMLLVVMAAVSLVLLLALRSTRVLLPALLANLLPLVLTAGTMAWLEIPINSINLFVGSVMLGIVVDDTVHLLHAWRARDSMEAALAEVGRPLWITSLTVGLAFATLAASELVPIRQFGLLSVVAVGSAWLCDTCLLPTLLGSRWRLRV